jgi:hypothetical protein
MTSSIVALGSRNGVGQASMTRSSQIGKTPPRNRRCRRLPTVEIEQARSRCTPYFYRAADSASSSRCPAKAPAIGLCVAFKDMRISWRKARD